jgi:Leucine rich repeat/Protein of unknown function (DUF1353)
LEVQQLTALQTLDRSSNQLTALPPGIGQLSALKSLNVSNNRLSDLPIEIGQLSELESLDVSYNKLRTLPSEMARLKGLNFLALDGNQLSNLPPEIGKLIAFVSKTAHKTDVDKDKTPSGRLEKFQIVGGVIVSIATTAIGFLTYELSVQTNENNVQLKRIEEQLSENRFVFERIRDIYDRTEKYLSSKPQDERRGRALVALISSLPDSRVRTDMLALIVIEAAPSSVAASAADAKQGRQPANTNATIQLNLDRNSFVGKALFAINQETYQLETLDTFGFKDSEGLLWEVPKGEQFNGAAIPRFMWSVFGSPFNGDYVAASVLYERYAQLQVRSSEKTLQMFHEALLKFRMSESKAKILVTAVGQFGPRWTVVSNHEDKR